MKKAMKTMVLAFILVFAMTGSIFADKKNPVKELQNDLIAAGVPSKYVGNIVEYLQKTTITKEQHKKIENYMKEAKKTIGNTKDLSKLPTSSKTKLQSIAVDAGKVIGLNVKFSKNTKGATTVIVTDAKGAKILELATTDVTSLITNFNINIINKAFDSMYKFSNNPDKGKFHPVGGELTETATPYGNLILAGSAMIMAAAGIFTVSKRQFA